MTLPQASWPKPRSAPSSSAAASATPAPANGSSNSAACFNTLLIITRYCHPEQSEGSAFLPAMREFRGNPRSNYFPRDGLRFTGVKIFDAAGNLLIPCCVGCFVDSGVEALDERASQFGAFFLGERERLLK